MGERRDTGRLGQHLPDRGQAAAPHCPVPTSRRRQSVALLAALALVAWLIVEFGDATSTYL
jgi:ferric-dicitrate binding protein FerR (iron transport regulator)